MRAPLLTLFPLTIAAAVGGHGCSRAPSAHVSVRRLEGPRVPQVLARCVVSGLTPPIQYQWKLAPSVHPVGWNPPLTEATVLAQLADNASGNAWAECSATGSDKRGVRATASLVPPRVVGAPTAARGGELVSVRGSGFGPVRGDGDSLYFVSLRGEVQAADGACVGATWSDSVVAACVPTSLAPGSWRLRLQAGEELALWSAPLVVGGGGK